jgi:hypothetical protein
VSLLTQFLPLLLAEDAKMAECENAKDMLWEKLMRIIKNQEAINNQEAAKARRIANGSGDRASSGSFDNASKNASCAAP